jgi:23S rRNA (uracil1939-C5)-methyltransferase
MEIKCIKLDDMNLAYTDQKIHVKYMLPNEVATIENVGQRLIKENQLTVKNPNRKKVICPIFYECGGCDFLHMTYDYQLELKQAYVHELFLEKGLSSKTNTIIKSERPLHYRHKVVLSATTSKKKLRLGLYREFTKKVIPFLDCFIHDKLTNQVLRTIEMLLNKYKIPAYDIDKNEGILKHVLIRKSYEKNDLMVVFVTNGNLLPNAKKMSQELVKKHMEVKTTVQNIHKKKTHLVLLDEEKVIYGPGYIIDKIDDLSFKLSAKSFYQVNPIQMFKLYHEAIKLADLSPNDIVLDAYSGIGTLSLLISKKAKKVIAIEVNEDAHKDAISNKNYNDIHNIDFINGDVIHHMQQIKETIDVLFMDPTREGASKTFIDDIIRLLPKKIVYISCEPKTQSRDIELLKDFYNIEEVQPVDMFSQTVHVENIVLLKRR